MVTSRIAIADTAGARALNPFVRVLAAIENSPRPESKRNGKGVLKVRPERKKYHQPPGRI